MISFLTAKWHEMKLPLKQDFLSKVVPYSSLLGVHWADLCIAWPIDVSRTTWIIAQCRSMPINADQNHPMQNFMLNQPYSMYDFGWEELIGIDRHWSTLINIGINARILIGIDRHWSALGIDRGSPVLGRGIQKGSDWISCLLRTIHYKSCKNRLWQNRSMLP